MACHDCLDSLADEVIVGLLALLVPLSLLQQNLARKLKQDLQNIWLPWQSCWRDYTPLKCSAYSLV